MAPNKALLVIDMQKGSFTEQTPRHNTEGVVNIINILADQFREVDLPVIYVQHDGTQMNEFLPNTMAWELLDELKVEPTDIFINKYANDVYYKSELQNMLNKLNVNELIITGCATDFCVESTIQSALTKDYNIVVVEDGRTTGDRPNLEAKQVINHYNWVWEHMLPTKGNIQVKPFSILKNDII